LNYPKILNVREGLVSNMRNYKKGLSEETIRILFENFKLNQEAFNRPYKLQMQPSPDFKNARILKRQKKLATA